MYANIAGGKAGKDGRLRAYDSWQELAVVPIPVLVQYCSSDTIEYIWAGVHSYKCPEVELAKIII